MTNPEADFDLEKLFLPAWAQQAPDLNRFAKHPGPSERDQRQGDSRGNKPFGARRPQGAPDRGSRGPRPGGPQGSSGSQGGRSFPPRDRDRDDRRESRPEPTPLPAINVIIQPDERGVDSLSHQIKMTGRAYPLFEIAQMILQKPERQQIRLEVIKKNDGQPAQQLFSCALDETLWSSEEEAVQHVLSKHFGTFYQTEKIPTDPPKGTYTFVAQCGMSGAILGPPNHHDYQNQLRRLHEERFARMPFDAFKARVKIVKDEVVVKKWLEDQSFKTEFIALNVPEQVKLNSHEEVEKHFRETHLPNIIKQIESYKLASAAGRELRSPGLQRLLRHQLDDQKRFPLKVVNILSQQFAQRGLQFFKVNKTITHVSVARPHFLDMVATPVSEGVHKIVDFVNAHPKCTRRKLFEVLAPTPKVEKTEVPALQPPAPVAAEGTTEAPPAETKPAVPTEPVATPQQAALISDLHWLIHQGHVIEFANGILETAKKPAIKPPKLVKQPLVAGEAAPVPNASIEEVAPEAGALEAVRPEGESTAPVETAAPEASASEEPEAPKGGSGQSGLDSNQPDEFHSSTPPPEIK